MANANFTNIELIRSGQKITFSYAELTEIMSIIGVNLEDPSQVFQLSLSAASGGKVLTEYFKPGDALVIEYFSETIVTGSEETPTPPPDVIPPTSSCESCLPDSFTVVLNPSGCNAITGTLEAVSSDDPVGTYNKTWRTSVEGCANYSIQVVCTSYDEDTNVANFDVRSMDSTYSTTIQFASVNATLPCPTIPDGSLTISFGGTIYPGYLTSIVV